MNITSIPQQPWDANLYQDKHGFVWQYGSDLLQLLNPKPGDRILDLGCGTGQLTEKIAQAGAEVMGIDNSPEMIAQAKQNYPNLKFEVADARNFHIEQPLDAVFSNATLHWVKEADAVISCVKAVLKVGGRFVVEFGGKGNIQAIATALEDALTSLGIPNPHARNPWFYPSIGEYASRLEEQGFSVNYAILFARPTPLNDGEAGMANWLKMFAIAYFSGLSLSEVALAIAKVENQLKPQLYRDGSWVADYRRIRVVATKIAG